LFKAASHIYRLAAIQGTPNSGIWRIQTTDGSGDYPIGLILSRGGNKSLPPITAVGLQHRDARYMKALPIPPIPRKGKDVSRYALLLHDAAQIERKVGIARQAAAFLVQRFEGKTPAFLAAAAVFAGEAIEPAFDPAGKGEVGGVDREHQTFVDDALIEPIGQDDLHAPGRAADRQLAPFVDPTEAVQASRFALPSAWCVRGRDLGAQVGLYGGRLQAVERGAEPLIPQLARGAARET